MTIINKTAVALKILGDDLNPGEYREYEEVISRNTLRIYSSIGNCVILTEYGQRTFRTSGNLVAKEGYKKDERGMKNIFIYSN